MATKCLKCHFENPENTRFCGGCGTKFPTADEISMTQTQTLQALRGELVAGSTFAGRYFVLEELGRGGMGRVYRVLDKKLDVEIALKLIKPEIALEANIIDRFKNELKLTRVIVHKNICRMFDLSEDQGNHFITMEYVPGENLKRTIHRVGSLNLGRALTIAKQICEGLAAAHHLDIVHRDLKPQNIMLDQSGHVRIMDFGISLSLRARGITADGIMVGTPEYISPEQAEGSKVDARTDIYSLGAILFEMVTGKVPFEGDTTLSIILKQKLEPPPDPGTLTPHLPKEISRIILKCLEKDRGKRYPDIEALYADLGKVEREILLKEKIPSRRKEEPGRAKKGIRPFLIPGISLALIGVLVSGYLFLGRGQKDKRGEAEEKKPAASETPPQKPAPQIAPLSTAPQYGFLEIDSMPQGASIFLNNKPEGTTPLKRELPPGLYEMKIRKSPEYKEVSESFSLKAGEKFTKNFPLAPLYVLEIVTTPQGADILVDGVLKGKTPREFEIAKNSCQLELRKGEGWAGLTEALRLNPGRNTIRRTLRQLKFNLVIKTNPPEARVIIGNNPPVISPVNKFVDPGVYEIKVEKEGFRTLQESLSVEADITKTFELANLRTGKIRFNINPYADIFVKDKLVGEVVADKTVELTEGKYPLKFVSAGLNKTLTVEVEIRSGESKEVRVNMLTGEIKIINLQERL